MSPRKYWPNKKEMEEIMPVPLGTRRYRIRHNIEDPPFIEQAEVVGAQLFYHPPANPRWLLNTKISPYFEAHEASDVSCYWSRLTMTDFMNNFTDDLPALQAQVPPLKWPSDTVQIVPVASARGEHLWRSSNAEQSSLQSLDHTGTADMGGVHGL